jgi:hypothetical protein
VFFNNVGVSPCASIIIEDENSHHVKWQHMVKLKNICFEHGTFVVSPKHDTKTLMVKNILFP